MTTRLLSWLPALVWMAIIYYWSSQPVLPIDGTAGLSSLAHILSHIGAYGILVLLLVLGTGGGQRGLWLAFTIAALYGVGDELHQGFTPGREASLLDVVVNTLSAAVALLLLSRLHSWQQVWSSRSV